jgi:hypothetical protein
MDGWMERIAIPNPTISGSVTDESVKKNWRVWFCLNRHDGWMDSNAKFNDQWICNRWISKNWMCKGLPGLLRQLHGKPMIPPVSVTTCGREVGLPEVRWRWLARRMVKVMLMGLEG